MNMNKKVISFIAVIILLPAITIYSAITGSIEVSAAELIKGLLTGTNENVVIIKDLRLPRIIISMFAGAALAVSGVLLQAVMRNPLAEPGIIGVSSGAGFFTILMVSFFPTLFFFTPLFAFLGGRSEERRVGKEFRSSRGTSLHNEKGGMKTWRSK